MVNSAWTYNEHVELELFVTEGHGPDLNKAIEQYYSTSTGVTCVLGCGPLAIMSLRGGVAQHIDLVLYGRTTILNRHFHGRYRN